MKLGVAGLLGDGSAAAVRRVREMGFRTASWHLPDLRLAEDRHALEGVRRTLKDIGVELCQLLPPQYPSLVHPDAAVRSDGVSALARVVEAASWLGAGCVYVRPGSLNAAGPWTPHAANRRRETLDRLVESLKRIADHGEKAGVLLAIEGHVVSPLFSAAVIRSVLDRVSSASLRFNMDPVNMAGNLDQAYDTTALIDDLFDRLGDRTILAHTKDLFVQDRLVLHIEECVPGQGLLDHVTFLRRFQASCPRGSVLIEHLPAEKVPEAREALLRIAAAAGLRFEEG